MKVAIISFEDNRKSFLYKTNFSDLKPGEYVLVGDLNQGFKNGIFQCYTNARSRIKQAEKWILRRRGGHEMLKCRLSSLDDLIKLFDEFKTIECKEDDVKLLSLIKLDLEELDRVKVENKYLKEQLESYKWENAGLINAYRENQGEIGYE